MRYSLIVFGVAVLAAPRGADCASKTNNPRERLVPEHAETSNTEEIKYLKSVWDSVDSWRYSETAALAELESYRLLYYRNIPYSNPLDSRLDNVRSPDQIALWQNTLEIWINVIRDLLVVEKGNSSERYYSKMGWNLAKPRRDETERARTIKRESFNEMQVDLKKKSRRENIATSSVVFEGTIGENRKVIVEYRSTDKGRYYWTNPNDLESEGIDPLLRNFWVLETLDRLGMKGLAPVPVGLSSPAIAPDYKLCVTDDRLVTGKCSMLSHSWMFRGLVTEPLLDETNNNIAKLADEFLADKKEQIKNMSDKSEKTKMKKQVFIDIIKIGGLIVDALEKLHDIGLIYRPTDWGKAIRVAETSNGLAVQLVDFADSFLYISSLDISLKRYPSIGRYRTKGPVRYRYIGSDLTATPATLLGYGFRRRDDIYLAIQFVAQMLESFNPWNPYFAYQLHSNPHLTKDDKDSLYLFKRYASMFFDMKDSDGNTVNYYQGLGSKRVVHNPYCDYFGLSSEKGSSCVTTLEHLDEALLRIQFIEEEIDATPDYENIKNSFANALIEANRLLNE